MPAKRRPEHRICSRCKGWFILQRKPLYQQRFFGFRPTCPQCTGHVDTANRYMLAEPVSMAEVERMCRAMMLGKVLDKPAEGL